MKIGTKSILFGAHCFLIHPVFVMLAWWKLYGFPWDPRLWLAFFVHDLGYWGKPNIDGPQGQLHVEFGANIMGIFGKEWDDLCRYHSRYYAKIFGVAFSKLCVADKLAVAMEPGWLYLPRVKWSGEIKEYTKTAITQKENGEKYNNSELVFLNSGYPDLWHRAIQSYLRRWALEHKDCKFDTWTPEMK